MIKIGIISFAHHHGEAYISNLRRMEGVELLGVADDDTARGEKIAGQNEARFFSSYEALLEAKPDGVIRYPDVFVTAGCSDGDDLGQ